MRRMIVYAVAVLLFSSTLLVGQNAIPKYRLGFNYGVGNLGTTGKPYYSFNNAWGMSLGTTGRYAFSLTVISQKNYTDSVAANPFTFFSGKKNAARLFKSARIGIDLDYRVREQGTFSPTAGIGLGYLIWQVTDPRGDTVIQTIGDKHDRIDFSAAEMYLSGSLGLDFRLSHRLDLHLKTAADYLTGVGTSFSDSTDSHRGRLLMRAGFTLSYMFGAAREKEVTVFDWVTEQAEEETPKPSPPLPPPEQKAPPVAKPSPPPVSIVSGDSDRDGVPDNRDDCPGTPPEAAGTVDVFGCPIDSDFDGIPDYRDRCPGGPVGAVVDSLGCPIDSDGDGVYDGLDDCPGTPPGVEVDTRGCLDVSFLRDTMRIYVNYQPGSFEIDEKTRQKLEPMVKKLLALPEVTFDIIGFTDNVGPAEANEALSQKRANRMRDWFESQGIARGRMRALGKGETNFLASNDTAEGRAKNRRIELIFSRP